ncbi:MAG: hypothetical protein NW207_07160 [Cytophagales bacterium]|nr:hypothetical protein [Cytophagales bacterium]
MKSPTFAHRLHYFIDNFLLVYKPTGMDIAQLRHLLLEGAKIKVPDTAQSFFESKQCIPTQIAYITYHHERIPIFFYEAIPTSLYHVAEDKCIFDFDIASSVFYYLSSWQELFAPKDHLQRFTYPHSIQAITGTVQVPVVNYYFLIFKEAIENVYSITLQNIYLSNGKFITSVTHDVDIVKKTWKIYLLQHLKKYNTVACVSILTDYISGKYITNNFNSILINSKTSGYKPTLFFLPVRGAYKGYRNADYDMSDVAKILEKIGKDIEIALHPGFEASENEAIMKENIANIHRRVSGCRYHFLMYNALSTPHILQHTSIKYDSTLGFNDMPGFRNGTSYPYLLFDFQTLTHTKVIEIPLIVMDATLFYAHYLAYKDAQSAFEYILPIAEQIKKTGGVLNVNFHNHLFYNGVFTQWQKLLQMIIHYAKCNHSSFSCLEDVYLTAANTSYFEA